MSRWFSLWLLAGVIVGCGQSNRSPQNSPLRVGYFQNLTHAQALVGGKDGTFARYLHGQVELIPFNAGPTAMEALLSGSLDASYVGSAPAIVAYVRSKGHVRVVAGAASGGAALVVRSVTRPEELVGRHIAVPQLGNTQDLALKSWLRSKQLPAVTLGEHGVQVLPLNNADTLGQFRRGQIEGAWVPEPWAARMIHEAGGKILVDERDLWWDRRFPATLLVVSEKALVERSHQIQTLLEAHRQLTDRWKRDPLGFAHAAHAAWAEITDRTLPNSVVMDAFSRLEPLWDPLPDHLKKVAEQAFALGYLPQTDLGGLVVEPP